MNVQKMTPHWAVGPSERFASDYIALCPSEAEAQRIADLLNADPDTGCTYTLWPILVATRDDEDTVDGLEAE